ncbi:hypothetical protein BSKO_02139 [Bryopsis sp. KO-2023]|nr:hypothetical protein BSKO_02139 [Bryopsis sp. KO-2023]
MRRHFAFLIATCIHVAIVSNRVGGEESLIGWKGETYLPGAGETKQEKWIENISWQPRAFVHHGLVSNHTTEHVIRMAAPFLKKSTIVNEGAGGVDPSIRNSLGTFLWRLQDSVITELQDQVATWTGIPAHHQEMIQVLRYEGDQMYLPHMDVISGPNQVNNRRIATVIIFLNDVDGAGDALLFFSVSTGGEIDPSALHGACPVSNGTKWVATIWMHEKPFQPHEFKPFDWSNAHDPADCYDLNPASCSRSVKLGHCESHAGAMLAKERTAFGFVGKCRKSCGICQECKPGDLECRLKNREQSGFVNFEEPSHGISFYTLASAGVMRAGNLVCTVGLALAGLLALFAT